MRLLGTVLAAVLSTCSGSAPGPAPERPPRDQGSTAESGGEQSQEASGPTSTAPAPRGGGAPAVVGYLALHLDPGDAPVSSNGGVSFERPSEYFDTLADLVIAADDHGGHELTMAFTGQWAHYVKSSLCTVPGKAAKRYGVDDCLSLVRVWEANGHEVAVHRHPVWQPAVWDGYTNNASWTADRNGDGVVETYGVQGPKSDPWYLGSVADVEALVAGLSRSGKVVSGCGAEFDGPGTSVKYVGAGSGAGYTSKAVPGDMISQPCARNNNDGSWVWEVRYRSVHKGSGTGVVSTELPNALRDYAGGSDGPWVLGMVSHAKDAAEVGIPTYEDIFDQLSDAGVKLVALSEVMGHFDNAKVAAGSGAQPACPSMAGPPAGSPAPTKSRR